MISCSPDYVGEEETAAWFSERAAAGISTSIRIDAKEAHQVLKVKILEGRSVLKSDVLVKAFNVLSNNCRKDGTVELPDMWIDSAQTSGSNGALPLTTVALQGSVTAFAPADAEEVDEHVTNIEQAIDSYLETELALQTRTSMLPLQMGTVKTILSGVETQEMAVRLIRSAERRIELSAYTFDFDQIAQTLIAAATPMASGKAAPKVRIYVDEGQALTGVTKRMAGILSELYTSGVEVRLVTQMSHQHSKTLRVDEVFQIVGSCNWTFASRKNFECGVLLKLNGDGRQHFARFYDALRSGSRIFDEQDARAAANYRNERARSASATPQRERQMTQTFHILESLKATRERRR